MNKALKIKSLSFSNKFLRGVWSLVWFFLFRPTPNFLHSWRRILLRLFGATIGKRTFIYPTVRIWAPWNLIMQDDSCLSHFVLCYSVDKIFIGQKATVSQYSHICTASHDFNQSDLPLITAPITINEYAWITSDVFIGPGVTIEVGAIVGARSTVIKNVEKWSIVAGNPAKKIGVRDKAAYLNIPIKKL